MDALAILPAWGPSRLDSCCGGVARRCREREGGPAVEALRPKQYTKNLLLFAALLFADRAGSLDAWVAAGAAFVAYCLASSAAYLVNDVRDALEDRKHPVKRLRPIARGDLSPRAALGLAAVLAAASVAVTAALGAGSLAYLAAFLGLQALYSAWLKAVVLLDVAAIAALFVIRASAGAEAVDVPISGWLLVSTALLASFLALASHGRVLGRRRGGRHRSGLGGFGEEPDSPTDAVSTTPPSTNGPTPASGT